MPRRELRFGIRDSAGCRAATWKLWTQVSGGKSDVYLACRQLGGVLKASLHESGEWHIAYSPEAFEQSVKDVVPKSAGRFIEKWPRPAEFAPGITLAFRIITPSSGISLPIKGPDAETVTWLPNAPPQKATEIDILLTKPAVPVSGWPGKESMGTSLVGSIPLENGEMLWAVYWVVPTPDLSSLSEARLRYFKGRGEQDLKGEGLRVLAIAAQLDGSRVIYDCAVKRAASDKQV